MTIRSYDIQETELLSEDPRHPTVNLSENLSTFFVPAIESRVQIRLELAWYITDNRGYYISESTVYRILKVHDLVTNPVYRVVSAHENFPQPIKAVNELWQKDFTFFKVMQCRGNHLYRDSDRLRVADGHPGPLFLTSRTRNMH